MLDKSIFTEGCHTETFRLSLSTLVIKQAALHASHGTLKRNLVEGGGGGGRGRGGGGGGGADVYMISDDR